MNTQRKQPHNDLSIDEVAKKLHCSPASVRNWKAKGAFPNAYEDKGKTGMTWRIPRTDVQAYQEGKKQEAKDAKIAARKLKLVKPHQETPHEDAPKVEVETTPAPAPAAPAVVEDAPVAKRKYARRPKVAAPQAETTTGLALTDADVVFVKKLHGFVECLRAMVAATREMLAP